MQLLQVPCTTFEGSNGRQNNNTAIIDMASGRVPLRFRYKSIKLTNLWSKI